METAKRTVLRRPTPAQVGRVALIAFGAAWVLWPMALMMLVR